MKRPESVGLWEGYYTLAPRHAPWYAALIGAVLLALALLVPAVRPSVLLQLLVLESAWLGVWLLLRAGHARAGSFLAVVTTWCVIAGAALITGGVGPIHYVTFASVLVMAGLLLGSGGAIIVALLTIGLGEFAPVIATIAPPAPALARVAFAYLFIIVFLALAQRELHEATRQRRRLEEELFQARKMESLGTLAGGIAHDFNNILTAIVTYTEMAQQDAADRPEIRESLSEVLRAALRASDLVRQILVFGRTRSEDRAPVSLSGVVRGAVELLEPVLPRGVAVELDPGEGELTVLADPAQIHQVLMNLGMNAGQSMHEGGGTLRIAVRPASVPPGVNPPATGLVPGPYAAVSVADTGPGMDSQTLGRIFEPFFSTRAPGAGSGLGLSVVHSIVRSHRGGISVESQPGSGSTFTIFLPSAEAKPGTAGISSGYN